MKFSAVLLIVAGLVACSQALPAKKRMIYVQQPSQFYASPQRMMYVQYVQPGLTHARSTQAASALVSGESVATGTYLKDCDHSETEITAAGPAVDLSSSDADVQAGENVLSVAEAFPEEAVPQVVEIEAEPAVEAPSNDAAKVPREYNFENAEPIPEVPVVDVALDVPASEPIVPVATPAKRYLPTKKKVYVELEQSAETDEAEEQDSSVATADEVVEDDDEDLDVAPVAPKKPVSVARRPAVKKPAKAAAPAKPSKPLPAGTFFPIDFGGTSGGAIAIANSFSTGEGGSATSHAIAYGQTPEAARRVRPATKRH